MKHYRFPSCRKSRIRDHLQPVEKNSTRVCSFIIRSNVVQLSSGTNTHFAHSRFQGNIICNGMYNSNIRRIHHKFTRKRGVKLHLETVCAEVKPCYKCWHCNATFSTQGSRQVHMRRFHGRICREQDINLFLHLQHLAK